MPAGEKRLIPTSGEGRGSLCGMIRKLKTIVVRPPRCSGWSATFNFAVCDPRAALDDEAASMTHASPTRQSLMCATRELSEREGAGRLNRRSVAASIEDAVETGLAVRMRIAACSVRYGHRSAEARIGASAVELPRPVAADRAVVG